MSKETFECSDSKGSGSITVYNYSSYVGELVSYTENEKTIQDLEAKLHKADSIWQAQEKQIQDLEFKLAKAVEAMEFALGNHFHWIIRKRLKKTLEEIEKGE